MIAGAGAVVAGGAASAGAKKSNAWSRCVRTGPADEFGQRVLQLATHRLGRRAASTRLGNRFGSWRGSDWVHELARRVWLGRRAGSWRCTDWRPTGSTSRVDEFGQRILGLARHRLGRRAGSTNLGNAFLSWRPTGSTSRVDELEQRMLGLATHRLGRRAGSTSTSLGNGFGSWRRVLLVHVAHTGSACWFRLVFLLLPVAPTGSVCWSACRITCCSLSLLLAPSVACWFSGLCISTPPPGQQLDRYWRPRANATSH